MLSLGILSHLLFRRCFSFWCIWAGLNLSGRVFALRCLSQVLLSLHIHLFLLGNLLFFGHCLFFGGCVGLLFLVLLWSELLLLLLLLLLIVDGWCILSVHVHVVHAVVLLHLHHLVLIIQWWQSHAIIWSPVVELDIIFLELFYLH